MNIILIMTDQQSANAMSRTGRISHNHLHTPALDRLAAQGTRFERAYCAQPLYRPSRASMITGRYPHEIGVDINNPKLGAARALSPAMWNQSLGQVFAGAGYDCAPCLFHRNRNYYAR